MIPLPHGPPGILLLLAAVLFFLTARKTVKRLR